MKARFGVKDVPVVVVVQCNQFAAPNPHGGAIDCGQIAVVLCEHLRAAGNVKFRPAEPVASGIDTLCRVIQYEDSIFGHGILRGACDEGTNKLQLNQGHVLRFIHDDTAVGGLRESLDSISDPNPLVSERNCVAFTQLGCPELRQRPDPPAHILRKRPLASDPFDRQILIKALQPVPLDHSLNLFFQVLLADPLQNGSCNELLTGCFERLVDQRSVCWRPAVVLVDNSVDVGELDIRGRQREVAKAPFEQFGQRSAVRGKEHLVIGIPSGQFRQSMQPYYGFACAGRAANPCGA